MDDKVDIILFSNNSVSRYYVIKQYHIRRSAVSEYRHGCDEVIYLLLLYNSLTVFTNASRH